MSNVNITLDIQGLDRVRANFDKMPAKLLQNINGAITKAAFLLENRAKREAPVDTGRLMRSINVRSIAPFKQAVGPHVNYALYVHEGTRFQKANPFLRRAAAAENADIQRIFDEAIESAINE
jgi:HK97 gp10 family phage protein